ncbi:lysis protein [Chimaeribacter arupi]|uniref:lysis protein n=1 Tax=Chimaeribacter arupi TaxID=2060066 RepID=UPI00294487A5|nr:lysis protein [Chimaeribacter arupi]MDV5140850.1 lysis protein [Chimaeribacter arupi]
MTSKTKVLIALVLLALLATATATSFAFYFRSDAINYKAQLGTANSDLKLAKGTITDMQTRQRDVAVLDAKYTKELADAKATIDQLHDDIATGKRRLLLKATCSNQSSSSTSGLDDAASPRLTDAAERDYFTLRSRIEIVTKQLTGLQAFVREQCFK